MSLRVPLPETGLPGLAPLINGSLWDRWHSEGRVFSLTDRRELFRYVRLKPDTSCRLTVFDRDTQGGFPPRGFRVDLYAGRERALVAFAKERGGFVDEEHLAVVTPFPNDPKIPGLRHCYRSYRLRRLLADLLEERFPRTSWRTRRSNLQTELLAYKPGRRAVVRVEVELVRGRAERSQVSVVLKLTEAGRAEPLHEKLAALDVAIPFGTVVRRPRLLGFAADRQAVALEYAPGTPLRRLPQSQWAGALAQAGRAVARLHAGAVASAPGIGSAGDRRSLPELAADFRHLAPFAAKRIEEIRAALEQLEPDHAGLIHGDLHAGQILAHQDGALLVDWDQAGRGPALRDVGGFLAHLEIMGARRYGGPFLRGYADESGAIPAERELQRWTARMLFVRLGDPFRRLLPDWPERTLALLGRIEELLRLGVAAG